MESDCSSAHPGSDSAPQLPEASRWMEQQVRRPGGRGMLGISKMQ